MGKGWRFGGGWGRVGEGVSGGVGEGLGRAWLSILQKPRLKNPITVP